MKKCEFCQNKHDGNYGSGRFCSEICARGFSTKNKNEISDETKNKISISLKERWLKKDFHNLEGVISNRDPENIMETSPRTVRKILKRLNEKEKIGCSRCGWIEGTGDIHHIYGKKIENFNHPKNLTYLCPNCHRLFHEKKIKPNELISFYDQIGDKWKKYYLG